MIGRILAVLVLALAATAGSAMATPAVWTVRGKAGTVVLFGSVHLLPAGLDWRPAALDAAIASANELYFELPVDDATAGEAATLMADRGWLAKADRLSRHLSSTDDALLRRVVARLGAPLDTVERMRPWLAEVTLSLILDAQSGGDASQGVERQIQDRAPPSARRMAFETARDQIDVLARAPETEQKASLVQTLKEIEERPNLYGILIKEWLAGDLAGLEADALRPLETNSPSGFKRLITSRNRRWAATIAKLAARPGTSVVVVGIGHLIGPQGVPALLRLRGLWVAGP